MMTDIPDVESEQLCGTSEERPTLHVALNDSESAEVINRDKEEFIVATRSDIDSNVEDVTNIVSVTDGQESMLQLLNDTVVSDAINDESCIEILSHRELKLSLNRLEQQFDTFHYLKHAPSVVIDLRWPKLVPLYTTTCKVPRRPQTAVRGRRRRPGSHSSLTLSSQSAPSNDKYCRLNDSNQPDSNALSNHKAINVVDTRTGDGECYIGPSTIIHLKFVESGDMPDAGQPFERLESPIIYQQPLFDESLSNSHENDGTQIHKRRRGGGNTASSDEDDVITVQNVNKTYSRGSLTPTTGSKILTRDYSKQTETRSKNKSLRSSGNSSVLTSKNENTSETKQTHVKHQCHSKVVGGKKQHRIGPSWYSRKYLNSPPPDLWDYLRVKKTFSVLKRANYVKGIRHYPLSNNPPTKRFHLHIPAVEQSELYPVGQEELKLGRLSTKDIEELQTQLRQEEHHRRSQHIMPLVMQMTDDQIEHAYEGVTESMKTYEIVAADSDVSEECEEELDDLEEVMEEPVMPVEQNNVVQNSYTETEYARNRPKRLAVDYSPLAFTPILLMEGRRVFDNEGRTSTPLSHQRTKRSCRVGTKKSRMKTEHSAVLQEENRQYEGVLNLNTGNLSERSKNDGRVMLEENSANGSAVVEEGDKKATNHDDDCSVVGVTHGERRSLFDGLLCSEHLRNMKRSSTDSNVADAASADNNCCAALVSPVDLVTIPTTVTSDNATHSPPPDLGQPMVTWQSNATASIEPPFLQLEPKESLSETVPLNDRSVSETTALNASDDRSLSETLPLNAIDGKSVSETMPLNAIDDKSMSETVPLSVGDDKSV